MRTLIQILGWIEHCEHDHDSRQATFVPTWLCSWEAFQEAEKEGYIEVKGEQPIIPRWGVSHAIYRLTDKGRRELYSALPRVGQSKEAISS